MNLIGLITGKNYIGLVKEFIGKVFIHEEKKFKCNAGDISMILTKSKNGDIQIMTYSNIENQVIRILPDKEAQAILMK